MVHERDQRVYKVPSEFVRQGDRVSLVQQKYKQMLSDSKSREALFTDCRTRVSGLTYMAASMTRDHFQRWCSTILLDTGCDFNLVSEWYVRGFFCSEWEKMITPLPGGSTVAARMATGHRARALGTVKMRLDMSGMS